MIICGASDSSLELFSARIMEVARVPRYLSKVFYLIMIITQRIPVISNPVTPGQVVKRVAASNYVKEM